MYINSFILSVAPINYMHIAYSSARLLIIKLCSMRTRNGGINRSRQMDV